MTFELLTLIVGGASALLSAIVSYLVGKRRAQTGEFASIVRANEQFRSEIRNELADARHTIEELRLAMKDKDKEIIDLQAAMSDLRAEVVEKDRKISDLKISLMKKDIKVAELAERVTLLDRK